MKIIRKIQNLILSYPVGEPIFNKNLAREISDTDGLTMNTASTYVAIAFQRLIEKGAKIKRYEKGVYYRYENCVFGDTLINNNKLIKEKYLKDNAGYEAGPAVLNAMGFTTLMSNAQQIIVSNAAARRTFVDKGLNIKVVKPKTLLTKKNIRYFQFLDLVKMISVVPLDNKQPELILKKYVETYELELDTLIICAYKYYERSVLEAVLQFVEYLKGGALSVSA